MVLTGGTGVLSALVATQDDGGAVLDDGGVVLQPTVAQPTTVHDGGDHAWTAPSWD